MPELGKYAFEVLMAYGLSIGLILALCGASLWRAKRVEKALRDVEARREK